MGHVVVNDGVDNGDDGDVSLAGVEFASHTQSSLKFLPLIIIDFLEKTELLDEVLLDLSAYG